MKKLIILLLSATMLSGCSWFTRTVFVPTNVPVVCENFENNNVFSPHEYVFVKAVTESGEYVLGLDINSYNKYTENNTKTLLYIETQNKAIEYYKKCIADHNADIQKKEP